MSDVGVTAPPVRRRRVHWLIWVLALLSTGSLASCVGCFVVGSRAADEGRDFAHATIRAVTRPWDNRELLARADSSLLDEVPAEKLGKMIDFVGGRLGSMTRCQPVQNGQWRTFAGTSGFFVVSTHYADCSFEKGPARITLGLIRRGGTWRVQSINFNSDLLLE
jgi:hypothetical protein